MHLLGNPRQKEHLGQGGHVFWLLRDAGLGRPKFHPLHICGARSFHPRPHPVGVAEGPQTRWTPRPFPARAKRRGGVGLWRSRSCGDGRLALLWVDVVEAAGDVDGEVEVEGF